MEDLPTAEREERTGRVISEKREPYSERACPRGGRPFLRLGAALAGYWLWLFVQGRLGSLLDFISPDLLNFGVMGFLSAAVLVPFWRMFPRTTGIFGVHGSGAVLAASAAVFIPFGIIAVALQPVAQELTAQWFILAGALLLLAAAEEIICRGFLLDVLSFSGNRMIGLALSSVIFGWFHIWNDHVSVAGVLNILLAGVLFGLLRLVSGGLVYPVLFHWLWNLVTGMVFGWSVSGHLTLPTLFRCSGDPPWGAFGPEESILMTVVMLGGAAILYKSLCNKRGRA